MASAIRSRSAPLRGRTYSNQGHSVIPRPPELKIRLGQPYTRWLLHQPPYTRWVTGGSPDP